MCWKDRGWVLARDEHRSQERCELKGRKGGKSPGLGGVGEARAGGSWLGSFPEQEGTHPRCSERGGAEVPGSQGTWAGCRTGAVSQICNRFSGDTQVQKCKASVGGAACWASAFHSLHFQPPEPASGSHSPVGPPLPSEAWVLGAGWVCSLSLRNNLPSCV